MNTDIAFRETLLKQMKDYLDGKSTKEEYYTLAESFYSQYAETYNNPTFHKYFLSNIPDACLFYIDEPGLAEEEREAQFYKVLSDAYLNLQKL